MSRKGFRITLQEHSFEIEVLDDPNRQEVRVRVNGKIWPVTVENLSLATAPEPGCTLPPTAPSSSASAHPEASGGENKARQGTIVKAPLPGVISAIFVQSKQPVRRGQELCSIETMKMDNVIQAPVAGVIDRISVCQGQVVNFDEPLVEIRP